MKNRSMAIKISNGDCYDVRELGEEQANGDFLLREYIDGV